jgi:hypothetical protein
MTQINVIKIKFIIQHLFGSKVEKTSSIFLLLQKKTKKKIVVVTSGP